MKNETEDNYNLAMFFYSNKEPCHIILNNGIFYNGYIKVKPSPNFFFIDDFVTGEKDIFFHEIKGHITRFIPKQEKGK